VLATSGTADVLLEQLALLSFSSPLLYVAMFVVALGVAWSVADGLARVAHAGFQIVLVGAAMAATVPVAITPSRADAYSSAARGFESRRLWAEAAVAYREAARLQPREPYYLTGLSRALIQGADALEADQRSAQMRTARTILERAGALDPGNPDHPRNLASSYRMDARSRDEDQARAVLLQGADRAYARAISLSPRLPSLWIEWANVDVERRRFTDAVAKLDRALALDESQFDAWLLRGHALLFDRDALKALAAYDRALTLKPSDVAASRGRAIALASLDRRDEAILAVDEVLARAPGDAASVRLRERLLASQASPGAPN
jgi:tetratricopeptide (TPR) repeat protein